jgi:hypothetical protein
MATMKEQLYGYAAILARLLCLPSSATNSRDEDPSDDERLEASPPDERSSQGAFTIHKPRV